MKLLVRIVMMGYVLFITSLVYGQNVLEIMDKVRSQYRPESVHALVVVSVLDRSITYSYTVELYLAKGSDDRAKVLLVFHKPASVRNIRFLSIERKNGKTDQWIYLPATRSIRRIVAEKKNDSFMGTDYAFSDFDRESNEQYKYKILREEHIEDSDTWVLEGVPPSERTFDKNVLWIDKKFFFPIRIEFYDKGKLKKVYETKELNRSQSNTYPTKSVMTSKQKKHQTKISIPKIEFNIKIPDKYFTLGYLKLRK